MNIFLDLFVIALAIYFIISGYNKGLIKSLLNFISSILAFFISIYLSSFISSFIYNNFIRSSLIDKISSILISSANEDVNTRISLLIDSIPKFISNSLGTYGVTSSNITDQLNLSANVAAINISNMMAPAIINVIKTISVFILFAVLMFLFSFVSKLINKITMLPILKQINSFLGAIFGFFEYIVFLLVACLFIRVLIPMIGFTPDVFSDETIDQTIVFKQVYHNNYYDDFIKSANDLY